MHPSLALIAHNPLFPIIAEIKINLFAVETIEIILVLFEALRTKVLYIVLVSLVVFGVFKEWAYFVAADVWTSVSGFGGRRRTV